MGYRTWMYHNDHEAKIFDSDAVPELEKQGWRDSPSKVKAKVTPPTPTPVPVAPVPVAPVPVAPPTPPISLDFIDYDIEPPKAKGGK